MGGRKAKTERQGELEPGEFERKGDKSRREQDQGEFGEQVNKMNEEQISQWSEHGMCSFWHKHKVDEILGPVSCSTTAVLCCFGTFIGVIPSA